MAEEMFDGFDHTQYKDEVTNTWGADAYAKGDAWWRSKSKDEQRAYQDQHAAIAADYQAARDAGEPADSDTVQAIVARHVDWLNLAAEHYGRPNHSPAPARIRRHVCRGPAVREELWRPRRRGVRARCVRVLRESTRSEE